MTATTPLYRYGHMAWFWRAVIVAAIVVGLALFAFGTASFQPLFMVLALILVLPATFFGVAVVVSLDVANETVIVRTLLPVTRRVPRHNLRKASVRQYYESDAQQLYAPAIWVRDGSPLPIYIDLLGSIENRRTFAAVFDLRESSIPRDKPSRGASTHG